MNLCLVLHQTRSFSAAATKTLEYLNDFSSFLWPESEFSVRAALVLQFVKLHTQTAAELDSFEDCVRFALVFVIHS